MKKIFIYILISLPVFLYSGCTKTMEGMNENELDITQKKNIGDFACKVPFTAMLKYVKDINGTWQYQVQETLNADVLAGYFMHPGNFGATATNDNYVFNGDKWNGQAFTDAQSVLNSFLQLEEAADSTYTDYLAYGIIVKVMSTVALVDAFGPYPYLQYGMENAPFDNVNDIYLKGFLPELDAAIDTLVMYSKLSDDLKKRVSDGKSDISTFKGDLGKWTKLGNTLRLRLAMRISRVAENKAMEYVKKCQESGIGYVDASTGDFALDIEANSLTNPFQYQSKEWDDLVMGSDIYSFLTGYEDPRIGVFFITSKNDTAKKYGLLHNYAAIRQGCEMIKEKDYVKCSQVNFPSFNKFCLFSGAESYFLLAEAALKGWVTDKTAEQYYNDGVTASFKMFGANGASSYLTSTLQPANYVDIVNSANNYNATTTITPKWDESKALEQIITQKWIAIFPNGAEAWAEFRRTGYPKIKLPRFMETGANKDGTIPQGEFVKRLPYPTPVKTSSKEGVNDAISKFLNGKDDGNQRLWWDID